MVMMKNGVRKLAVFLMAIGLCGASLCPASAYGPERQTFTWSTPADLPTFNSVVWVKGESPAVVADDDERNFVAIRECPVGKDLAQAGSGPWEYNGYDLSTGQPTFKVEPGKVYEVMIKYHNNAKASMNVINESGASWQEGDGAQKVGPSVASGAMVTADLFQSSDPLTDVVSAGQKGRISGSIFAQNAVVYNLDGSIMGDTNNNRTEDSGEAWQRTVQDEVCFYSDLAVSMRFVSGSARNYTNYTGSAGVALESALINGYNCEEGKKLPGTGAILTSMPKVNGKSNAGWVFGCTESAGYVTFRVQAVAADQDFTVLASIRQIFARKNVKYLSWVAGIFAVLCTGTAFLARHMRRKRNRV
jgi:hypothetical protein